MVSCGSVLPGEVRSGGVRPIGHSLVNLFLIRFGPARQAKVRLG